MKATGRAGPIRVCFRFDDPRANSDHALEARVLEVFRSYGFPLTVAVVPFSLEGEAYRALQPGDLPHISEAHDSGHVEVALHGYRHKAISNDPGGVSSEFFGVDRSRQLETIRAGKVVLEEVFGVPMRGFVPPWNTHDQNTLDASAELGFSYLSCGVQAGGSITKPLVIPKTCSMRRAEAHSALWSAKRHLACEPVIVFVFHPDNFVEFRSPPGPGEGPAFLSIPKLGQILADFAGEQAWITVCTLAEVSQTLETGRTLWTSVEYDFIRRASWRLRTRFPLGFCSISSKRRALSGALWGRE